MPAARELLDALLSFKDTVNNNRDVQRIVKGWNTKVLLWAKDLRRGFLLMVVNGKLESIAETEDERAGLVRVVANSDVMLRMFTG
ncbi:MAG: hypothetical protein QW613_04035, partial [Thermoprotei archaeon]